MKEKQRKTTEARKKTEFVPCETETGLGVRRGGTQCIGGMRVSMRKMWARDQDRTPVAMYGGRPQQFAEDCQCMIDWRNENKPEVA